MAAGPTAHHRVLHRHVLQRLGEAWRVLPTGSNRLQELVILDADEILEADAVATARHEVAVRREAVACEDGGEAGVLVLSGDVDTKFVHLLEVPGDRALRAVDLEAVLALRADHRTTRLERAASAALEDAEHPDVVLVGDFAHRIAGLAAVVVRATARGNRALLDERLAGPQDLGDSADQVVAEVDRMAED